MRKTLAASVVLAVIAANASADIQTSIRPKARPAYIATQDVIVEEPTISVRSRLRQRGVPENQAQLALACTAVGVAIATATLPFGGIAVPLLPAACVFWDENGRPDRGRAGIR